MWNGRKMTGYYNQCCDEHWGTCVSFNSGFLSVYAQQWDCWIIRQFYFQMTQRDGMGREEGSGWGTHVYLWQIHFDIWQNQYNIVKLNKIKFLKRSTRCKF